MRLPIYAQDSSDMKMNAALTTILLCLSLVTVTAVAQSRSVKRIVIVSGGGGEGESGEFVITRKTGAYLADGIQVPDELVANLLSAIDAPVVAKTNLANLGITQEWLDANADNAMKEYAEDYFSRAAKNQQALYFSSFKDPKIIERVLPDIFDSRHSDDYPIVEVEITETNGRVIKVSSEAQPVFMVPWVISRSGRKLKTYNADIGRAVANLMPNKFANKGRLAGNGLLWELARAVMYEIEDRWELLNVENEAKPYLDQLRERFTVTTAEINGSHNVDYGKEWVNGSATETNLHATLRRQDFPENFSISVVLPFKDGKVENVDGFLNSIELYKGLALSVDWLNDYLTNHPNVQVELRFVKDRSFSEKAMKSFAKDMGRYQSLVNEVAAAQKDICLLWVGGMYSSAQWLFLPDKRMVIWRHQGRDSLLK